MFHHSFEGELDPAFVVEDAATWDQELADWRRDAIEEVLGSG